MLEKTILLEDIEPIVLYGTNNNLLETVKEHFPKLKIIGRGHELKAFGSKSEIERFEKKVEIFIAYYHRYHRLSQQDISDMLEDDAHGTKNDHGLDFLLYGNHGKVIRARTLISKNW